MSVKNGQHVTGVQGGAISPTLSSAMHGFEVDYWPIHEADIGNALAQVAAPHFPIFASHRAVSGEHVGSYHYDYYYRVHIRPSTLALGNLVTAQTREVEIWNAWPDRALTLDDVAAVDADGVTIVGPGAFPLAFQPLQARIWTLSVSTDGPPVIAATLSWLFAGLAPVLLHITGDRLTAWTIPPRWHNGMLERLEWLSEVQEAVDGNQDAYPLRDTPRRTWEFDVRTSDAGSRLLESTLYDWSARNWAFPVSPDHSLLAADLGEAADHIPLTTAYLDYTIGGLAMLWTSPTLYELVQIDAVQSDALLLAHPTARGWARGTRIYPVRIARLADRPQLQHITSRRVDAHVRMEAVEPCDWPAIAPATTYAGYPVLEHANEISTAPTAVYERQLDELDDEIGAVSIDDITGLAWGQQSHTWKIAGRAKRAALRSLLYYFDGRVNRIWVATDQDDLILTAGVDAETAAIDIAWCGYSRYLRAQPGRKHVRVTLFDGQVFYRAITNYAELNPDTERLSLDQAFGQDIAPAQVMQISYLALCALAGDAAEIQHVADSEGEAICQLQFAQVPGNE